MISSTFFLMAGNPQDPNAGIINLVFLGAIFLVFYFFIIRPQSKAQKEIKEKVENMKKAIKLLPLLELLECYTPLMKIVYWLR